MSQPAAAAPYGDFAKYLSLLPEYDFEGRTDLDIVAETLGLALARAPGRPIVADCGAGPGRLWDWLVATHEVDVLAVEPNRRMWRSPVPPQVRYVAQDGLHFLRDASVDIGVVVWLWSLNYAILHHFENYDPESRTVIVKDWSVGASNARRLLADALGRRRRAAWVVLFFDSESPEQEFVTSLWARVAPFPFNTRAYTRRLFEDVAEAHCAQRAVSLTTRHLSGTVTFGNRAVALEKLHGFHFRGHFASDLDTSRQIEEFVEKNESLGLVSCGAGVYVYTMIPTDDHV